MSFATFFAVAHDATGAEGNAEWITSLVMDKIPSMNSESVLKGPARWHDVNEVRWENWAGMQRKRSWFGLRINHT